MEAQPPPLALSSLRTGAKRTRVVRINSSLVQGAAPKLKMPMARVALNLFPGEETVVVIVRSEDLGPERWTSYGHIENCPGSQFTVSAQDSVIAATAFIPGRGSFQILHSNDQWHVINVRTDHIAVAFWILEFSYPLPNEDRLLQLYELFKRQVFAKELILNDALRVNTIPLKDLTVDNVFTIRIPDWSSYEHVITRRGHPSWSCWDENGRPGKLFMAYEVGKLAPELKGLDSAALLRTFESHLIRTDYPERRCISKTEIKAPLGQILRVIEDEKPRPLELDNLDRFYVRYHQWFDTMTDARNFLRLFFNLSFPLRKLDHPDAKILPDLIEREILALRPLPPFEPIAP